MTGARRMMGVLVVTVVAAFSVCGQDATKSQTTQQSGSQVTRSDYVFPTPRERFKRYVMSTVGPTRLAWSAASAGISQWHDEPEEWGQGAKGYGKRYASSLGQNAINYKDGLRSGTTTLLTGFGINLVREFVINW